MTTMVRKTASERIFQDAFVDGSETGLPVKELSVEKPALNTEKDKSESSLGNAPRMPLPIPTHLFSWPLSKGVLAEVKLTGDITAEHLEMLRSYLDLAKKAMA